MSIQTMFCILPLMILTQVLNASLMVVFGVPVPVPYDIATFNAGIHQLLIRAIDTSGNKDPMPILYRWDAATNE